MNIAIPTNHAPKVSVIIPTYNRAADLRRCLDSLLAQTFKDFEVLVCDDGSTDETGEVAQSYTNVLQLSYLWAENFGGPARPRNNGLRNARGTYIAFLDSDDWWAPRKLEESVRRLDAGADLVYHDLYAVTSQRQKFFWRKRRTRRLKVPVYEDLLLRGNALCNSSVVLRRETLQSAGGISEDRALIAWEDYETWVRIAAKTDRFERLDEPLGYYWLGGGNLSSPQKLLVSLARFKELYFGAAPGSSGLAVPGWHHYLCGVAHYRLGSYSLARPHLRNAIAASLPFTKQLKAVAIMMLSIIRGATT